MEVESEQKRVRALKMPSLLVAFIFAGLCFCPRFILAQQTVTLAGQTTDQKTGKPIVGIEVGVSCAKALAGKPAGDRIKPEKTAKTDQEGRFKFAFPANMEGLDRVLVFTCAKDRINQIHPDVTFRRHFPTSGALQQKAVTVVDLTHDVAGIHFRLPPAPTIKRNVMVPMRDGVRLATDVYLPAGQDQPLPTLLYRTPYGKAEGDIPFDDVNQNYAVVYQDFRGRFASEGESDLPFRPDGWGKQQDGYDAIEWIASQPWCNGKVGTVGASAPGITQIMTAGSAPPHLTCQFIAVACGSLYHHAAFPGGAFGKALVEGWTEKNKFSSKTLGTFLKHPSYDDFWRSIDASTRSEQINVPGLFMGGWYDVFCQGTVDAFMWRQNNGGRGARGKQKLIMGPWGHGQSVKIGEFALPDYAMNPPKGTLQQPWFAYWLKGEQNGIMDSSPVTYYVLGAFGEPGAPGHEWRQADVWPITSKATPFYFHADGNLSTSMPVTHEQPRTYEYDPKNPVPTLGGCNLTIKSGPFNQQPVEKRPDVLLYTSSPLGKPLEITGRIKVVLFAASSCRDTDFTAKLTDVYPDGKSVLIQDGIIRARHRGSFEREELLTPGKPYRFEIDLWSTSIILNKEHRLRVAISSSNAPRFDPNPNTGDPFRANDKSIVAKNSVYHDGSHASHVVLPLVGD